MLVATYLDIILKNKFFLKKRQNVGSNKALGEAASENVRPVSLPGRHAVKQLLSIFASIDENATVDLACPSQPGRGFA